MAEKLKIFSKTHSTIILLHLKDSIRSKKIGTDLRAWSMTTHADLYWLLSKISLAFFLEPTPKLILPEKMKLKGFN